MKYPKIIAEIEKTHWAIVPEALRGILKAIEIGLSAGDSKLFHRADSILVFGDDEKPLDNIETYRDKGILILDGPIIPRGSEFSNISGYISLNKVTEAFNKFEANEKIKEIVLVVDSPGGAVTGVSDFSNLIKNSSKQVSVFVTGHSASAAYWISTGAHHIAAADTALVGSIGVVMAYRDRSRALEKMGIEDIEIVSSQSPDKRPDLKTKSGKAVMQNLVDDLADVFIGKVAENREVSIKIVENDFGQGGMLVANKALQAGMIDEILSFDDFMDIKAQERGGRSEIRTLIFKKENFSTSKSAQNWAKDHDFKSSPVIEKEETWHITQNIGNYIRTRTGRPLSPGVTPVFGILKRQTAETQPAQIAGERTAAMTLAEFLAENPAAMAELEAIKVEHFEAGKTALRMQHEKIAKYLQGDSYPEEVKNLAIEVIKGKSEFAALEGAATVIDSMRQKEKSKEAEKESAELPETPPIIDEPSADGEIKNPADFQAYWNGFHANRPESEAS